MDKKYKILFFSEFPVIPNRGGVQRVTSILAKAFEEENHQFFYLSSVESKVVDNLSEKQYYLKGNNSIHAQVKEIVEFIEAKKIDVIINQAGIYTKVIQVFHKLRKINKSIKILTVHHNSIAPLNEHYREIILGNNSLTGRILDGLNQKWIWSILKYRNRLKYKRLFQNSINISDRLVLLSHKFIPELQDLGVSLSEKVDAIPNPASFTANPQALQKKENRIAFVGRLNFTQKRVDRLMDIFHVLHERHIDWYFDVVGDGAQRSWMERYKAERQLSRITFYGFSDPKPILEKAKIFTLSSDFEGFGMVLLEANAYGAVPVSFPCFSGIKDIIAEGTGVVVDEFDTNLFIKAVEELIISPVKLSHMAQKGLDNVSRFDSKLIAKNWISLIDSISYEE